MCVLLCVVWGNHWLFGARASRWRRAIKRSFVKYIYRLEVQFQILNVVWWRKNEVDIIILVFLYYFRSKYHLNEVLNHIIKIRTMPGLMGFSLRTLLYFQYAYRKSEFLFSDILDFNRAFAWFNIDLSKQFQTIIYLHVKFHLYMFSRPYVFEYKHYPQSSWSFPKLGWGRLSVYNDTAKLRHFGK